MAKMIAALYGRSLETNKSENITRLFGKLSDAGIGLLVYKPFYDFIKDSVKIKGKFNLFSRHAEIDGKADVLISLGGDGTLLETLEFVKDTAIPVMGVNTGRLGFLSSISTEEINFAVDALVKKKYVIDTRTMLVLDSKKKYFGDVNYALNDITISKSESSSMITTHVYLNNEFLNSYYADGLIISTPTGSTAYSLSCGGPIVMPDSGNFIVTPVAPHNLNVRPIIISDDSILKIKVECRESRFLVTLDSRSMALERGSEFIVKKAGFNMNIVKLEDHNFLSTLRNKLMWGLDKRT